MKREDRTRVVLLTENYRIVGDIALVAGARLTDFITEAKGFIAVVDAEVTDHSGREILSAPFVNVNRDRVEVLVPA
jgi:Family of unknown function (DUF6812)